MKSRRQVLRSLITLPAALPLTVLTQKAAKAQEPPPVPPPVPAPPVAVKNDIDTLIQDIANEGAALFSEFVKDNEMYPFYRGVMIPFISRLDDTVIVRMGRNLYSQGRLNHHYTANARCWEGVRLFDPKYREQIIAPAILSLVKSIKLNTYEPGANPTVVFGRLPIPLAGTGAAGAIGYSKDVCLRAILTFDARTLTQELHFDTLYGSCNEPYFKEDILPLSFKSISYRGSIES